MRSVCNSKSRTEYFSRIVWSSHENSFIIELDLLGSLFTHLKKKQKKPIPSLSHQRTLIEVKATSHTRLSARDQYTSSTLIGGKGGAGPSSLHTTLEGPPEYVNARWMYNPHGFLRGIEWIMFHGHLDYFRKIISWR